MANFTQMELQSIRECVSSHKTVSAKLSDYAERCADSQIRQMFSKAAKDADQSSQNLINML